MCRLRLGKRIHLSSGAGSQNRGACATLLSWDEERQGSATTRAGSCLDFHSVARQPEKDTPHIVKYRAILANARLDFSSILLKEEHTHREKLISRGPARTQIRTSAYWQGINQKILCAFSRCEINAAKLLLERSL